MRKEFKISQEDIEYLKSIASKPLIFINLGNDIQEDMNMAWVRLGYKYGFEGMTASPSDKGESYVLAEPMAVGEQISYWANKIPTDIYKDGQPADFEYNLNTTISFLMSLVRE